MGCTGEEKGVYPYEDIDDGFNVSQVAFIIVFMTYSCEKLDLFCHLWERSFFAWFEHLVVRHSGRSNEKLVGRVGTYHYPCTYLSRYNHNIDLPLTLRRV